jgi:hypothetical protein
VLAVEKDAELPRTQVLSGNDGGQEGEGEEARNPPKRPHFIALTSLEKGDPPR